MRTLIFVLLTVFSCSISNSSSAHDVDGDGNEGLAEAIHALQVASGMTPDLPDTGNATVSDVLAGRTFTNSDTTGLTGKRPPAPIAAEHPGPFYGEPPKPVDWPDPRLVTA